MKIQKYLQQSPVLAIQLAYEKVISQINRELKADDLNLLQGLVLTTLFFEESSVAPSALARIFQTSRGNISHILSHLEYAGLVKRMVNKNDARQFQIELKAEGRKKALNLIKYYDKLQDMFEKEIGATQCQKTVEGIHSLITAYQNDRLQK